nr:hypothetical protein [Tanacetum cinerariifolium]
MINILNNPLLRQLSAFDDDINNGNASPIKVRESIRMDSSHDIQKKRVLPEDQIFGCSPVHKRIVTHSSTYSTFSDPSTFFLSPSSSSSGYFQGILDCSWNYGFPLYVFSIEDQREDIFPKLNPIGMIAVTKITHSILELRKWKIANILVVHGYVGHGWHPSLGPSDHSELVGHGYVGHGRHPSLATTPQTITPSVGTSKDRDGSDTNYHILDSQNTVEIEGWGLKFLREGGYKQKVVSPVTQSVPCEPCRQNTNNHSSTMDVVPAGVHAGQERRMEVLLALLKGGGVVARVIMGCKQSIPVTEVTNAHDGLYYIPYHSSVSALQSLSIAVSYRETKMTHD